MLVTPLVLFVSLLVVDAYAGSPSADLAVVAKTLVIFGSSEIKGAGTSMLALKAIAIYSSPKGSY